MTTLNYASPAVDARWSDTRETHRAVAMAIHAIASHNRTPELIWADPTDTEVDHVTAAVQNYVEAGVFRAEDDGRYPWGQGVVTLE